MALVLADRVRDTTTTTGTGTVTLSGTAPTGYQNFSVIGNANTTYYTINAGSQWEVGIGTYSATGPTLARNTVLESSNANALVNFSAGTKDVFVTYPSDRAVTTDGVETLTNKTINGSNNTITNVSLTTAVTGTLPVANGGTGVTTSTGTTSVVLSNSPVLVTPTLGAASATSIANGLGAVGTPSYTFTGDTNTGMWSPAADTLAFSEGGVEAMRIDSSGNVGIGTTGGDFGRSWRLVARQDQNAITNTGVINTTVGVSAAAQISKITGTGNSFVDWGLADNNGSPYDTFAYGSAVQYVSWFLGGSERMRLNSSGNLGVGTSSPTDRLNVSDGTANIQLKPAGGSSIGYVGLRSNHALGFTTNDTERARIATDGAMTLNVGGVSGTHSFLYNESGGEIQLVDSTGAGPILLDNSGGLARFLKVGTGSMAIGTTGVGAFLFQTNNTERMRITDAGNVGIGTTSPVQRLHVRQDQDGTTAALIQNRNGTGSPASALQFISGAFDLSDNRYAMISSAGGSNTTLQFWTGEGAAPAERARITSAGNLGVGTTTPLARLFAETPTSVGAALAYAANSNGAYPTGVFGGSFGYNFSAGGAEVDFWNGWTGATGTQGGFAFRRQTGASSQNLLMTIRGDGNVGIGTSSPLYQATVLGLGQDTAALTDAGNKGGSLYLQATGITSGSGGALLFGTTFGNQTPFAAIKGLVTDGAANTIGDIAFSTRNATSDTALTERMRILRAGNVGIGTSSPGATLDVAGTIRTSAGGSDPGTGTVLYFVGSGSFQSVIAGAAFAVHTGNNNARTERMRVDINGNVGIGTSSPGAKLDVVTASGANIVVSRSSAAGYAAFQRIAPAGQFTYDFYTINGVEAARITVTDTNIMAFATGSAAAERMRIDASGNVGIGTTNPAGYKLRVVGSSGTAQFRAGTDTNGYLEVNAFDSAPVYCLVAGANATAGVFGTQANIPTVLFTNNTERMRIDSSGNVGIGLTSLVSGYAGGGPALNIKNGGSVVWPNASGTWNTTTAGAAITYFTDNNLYIDAKDSASNMIFRVNGDTERVRINSSGQLLVGTTTGGRTVCINAADNWMRFQNPSRSWLIGPSIGTSFNIWDETGGYNAFNIDTSANINARNSMFLGSGQNLDNKIEIGSGRTGSNYAYIDLIGDTTYTDYGLRLIRGNGGANTTSQLVHRGTGDMYITTQDAAPMFFQTSSTTRMYIEAGGTMVMNGALLVGRNTVGSDVNTNNDTGSFSVRGDASNAASMSFHRTGAYAINMGLGTDNVFRIGGWSASSNCFQMDGSGNLTMLGNVTAYSDARMKKDVETIDSALDLVSKMRGVRYTRTDTQQRGVGVIAQEMLEVCPEVVQQGIGNDDTLSVAYGNIVGVLIEAIKELRAEVAELKGK